MTIPAGLFDELDRIAAAPPTTGQHPVLAELDAIAMAPPPPVQARPVFTPVSAMTRAPSFAPADMTAATLEPGRTLGPIGAIEDAATQFPRGLAESGYGTAQGLANIAPAMARNPLFAGVAPIIDALGGWELPGKVRESREEMREFYGDPESLLGSAAGFGGAMLGTAAQYAVPTTAAARLGAPAALLNPLGGTGARAVVGRTLGGTAMATPLNAVLSQSPEDASATFLADLTGSGTLRKAAEDPLGAFAVETGIDLLAGGAVEAAQSLLAGRRARRAKVADDEAFAEMRRTAADRTAAEMGTLKKDPIADFLSETREPAQPPSRRDVWHRDDPMDARELTPAIIEDETPQRIVVPVRQRPAETDPRRLLPAAAGVEAPPPAPPQPKAREFDWDHDPNDGPQSVEGWKVTAPDEVRSIAAALRMPGLGADSQVAEILEQVARDVERNPGLNVADALKERMFDDAARVGPAEGGAGGWSFEQGDRALRLLRGDEDIGPNGPVSRETEPPRREDVDEDLEEEGEEIEAGEFDSSEVYEGEVEADLPPYRREAILIRRLAESDRPDAEFRRVIDESEKVLAPYRNKTGGGFKNKAFDAKHNLLPAVADASRAQAIARGALDRRAAAKRPPKPPRVEPPKDPDAERLSDLTYRRNNIRHQLQIDAQTRKAEARGENPGSGKYPDAELPRIRQKLKDIDKEIRELKKKGAKEKVEVDDEPDVVDPEELDEAEIERRAIQEEGAETVDYWRMPMEELKAKLPRAVPTSFKHTDDEVLKALTVHRLRTAEEDLKAVIRLEEVESLIEGGSTGRPIGYEGAKRLFGTAEDARRWQHVTEEQVGTLSEKGITPQDLTAMHKAALRFEEGQKAIQRLHEELERRGVSLGDDADSSFDFVMGTPARRGLAAPGRKKAIENAPSLFDEGTTRSMFGDAPTLAESDVGKRKPQAPKATGQAPEMPGAIGEAEMRARRDELGGERREIPGEDDAAQEGLFSPAEAGGREFVSDERGRARTFYHGSESADAVFSDDELAWVTADKGHAREYADDGTVRAFKVRAKKILDLPELLPDVEDLDDITYGDFERRTGLSLKGHVNPALLESKKPTRLVLIVNHEGTLAALRAAGYDAVRLVEQSGRYETLGLVSGKQQLKGVGTPKGEKASGSPPASPPPPPNPPPPATGGQSPPPGPKPTPRSRLDKLGLSKELLSELTASGAGAVAGAALADEDDRGWGALYGAAAGFAGTRAAFKIGRNVKRLRDLEEAAQPLIRISRDLAKAVGVPLRQGRFLAKQRRAIGVFFPHKEVTRLNRFGDVSTAAHEVGHYVSKKHLRNPTMMGHTTRGAVKLPKAAIEELRAAGQRLYGSRKPNGGYGEEGIAEYFSYYVKEPSAIAKDFPEFEKAMQAVYAKEPQLKAALDQARTDFARYKESPAAQKIAAMLSVDEQVRNAPTLRDYEFALADDLADIRRAVEELKPGMEPSRKNPYTLARLTRGWAGVSEEFLERGVVIGGKRVSDGIAAILREIPDTDLQAFREYLASERALELSGRGIDSGLDLKSAREVAAKDGPRFREQAERLWKFGNALLDYRVEKGLLLPEDAVKIKELNKRRVPFYRVFDEDEAMRAGFGSKKARSSSGIKAIRGSDREIVDPLESFINDVYQTVRQGMEHEAATELLKLATRTEGGGRIAEFVPIPMVKKTVNVDRNVINQLLEMGLIGGEQADEALQGIVDGDFEAQIHQWAQRTQAGPSETKDLVIPVVINGKRKFVAVKDRNLYNTLLGMNKPEMSMLERILSAPTRTLRAGATLTPEFIARNPVRDAATAFIRSFSDRPVMFGGHLARGLLEYLAGQSKRLAKLTGKGELYQRWRLAGGDNATQLGLDRPQTQQKLEDLRKTAARKGWEFVTKPIQTLRMLSQISENATRIGEFTLREQQLEKRRVGKPDAEARAAFESREVITDFAKAGAVVRPINQISEFVNAQVQGNINFAQDLRKRPTVVLPRLIAGVTIPSVALYLAQKDDPVYEDIPTWARDVSWAVVWPPLAVRRATGMKDSEAKVWLIPKPFEQGVSFGTVAERAVEFVAKDDPEQVRKAADALFESFVPSPIPTVAKPLIENFANKSLFTGRPIVPRDKEGELPAAQSAPRTGELARTLGEALGYSPAKIENTVRGYTGGLGQEALRIGDRGVRMGRERAGMEPLRPNRPEDRSGLSAVPGLRAFVRPAPGLDAESFESFYRDRDRGERARQTWHGMMKEGRFQAAKEFFDEHRTAIALVGSAEDVGTGPLRENDKELTELREYRRQVIAEMRGEERKRVLEQIDEAMLAIVRNANRESRALKRAMAPK